MKLVRSAFVVVAVAIAGLVSGVPLASAAFPGGNGPIVFQQNGDGSTALYVINSDGTGKHPLGVSGSDFNGTFVGSPSFSNGSQQVAYNQTVRDDSSNYSTSVRVINADGTGDHVVTPSNISAFSPAFSPDGSRIVLLVDDGETGARVYSIKTDGTGLQQLTTERYAYSPVYSPDGSKIAFFDIQTSQLVLMNADGSDNHVLANSALGAFGRASFTPDGTRIAFFGGNVEAPGDTVIHSGLQSIAIDGSDRREEVLVRRSSEPYYPNFSPDGTSLGYLNQSGAARRAADASPFTPVGYGFNISNLTTGDTDLIVEGSDGELSSFDWGNTVAAPPTCQTDPSLCPPPTCQTDASLCPPPPPAECKMRFSKGRFFIFNNKPAYRLVARYFSDQSGTVKISFYSRNADGSKGISLGSVNHDFTEPGKFVITRKLNQAKASVLRGLRDGFIAEMSQEPTAGYCDVGGSINLTKLKRIKKQFVWFQP